MLRLPSRFAKVLVSSRQDGILITIATVKIKKIFNSVKFFFQKINVILIKNLSGFEGEIEWNSILKR